ncbi:hypothetical protein N2152v2_003767 [Parachlorella kessleri]
MSMAMGPDDASTTDAMADQAENYEDLDYGEDEAAGPAGQPAAAADEWSDPESPPARRVEALSKRLEEDRDNRLSRRDIEKQEEEQERLQKRLAALRRGHRSGLCTRCYLPECSAEKEHQCRTPENRLLCWSCGELGHGGGRSRCPNYDGLHCDGCGDPGHVQLVCRKSNKRPRTNKQPVRQPQQRSGSVEGRLTSLLLGTFLGRDERAPDTDLGALFGAPAAVPTPVPMHQMAPVPPSPVPQLQKGTEQEAGEAALHGARPLLWLPHGLLFKSDYRPLDVAKALLAWVFRLYGYPKVLVSDRDSAFTSEVWQELHKLLGTKLAMSTAYHPQTDGQTERAHRTLEEMLRAFVDEEHTNWDELLPLCEFAYNSSEHRSTGQTPFRMMNGREPPTPAALLSKAGLPREPSDVATAAWLVKMHRAWESARRALAQAAATQKRYADKHRRPTAVKVGDQVKMERKFILKTRAGGGPKGKLNPPWVGPFTVIDMVSPNAAKLQLPDTWRMHPVVNVSRLEPYYDGSGQFPERGCVRPEDVPLPVPAEFPFLRMAGYLASRHGRGGRPRELLVQWTDLPEPSWLEAKLCQEQCRLAHGSDYEHKRMLDRMKRLNS